MITIGNCKDCKNWSKDEHFQSIGDCGIPVSELSEDGTKDNTIYSSTYEECQLRTGKDFGCVNFEQK